MAADLTIHPATAKRWGDLVAPLSTPGGTAQPNMTDVAALVDKFQDGLGAPIKAQALLAGVDPYGNVSLADDFNFMHIAACVDAFRGLPYPYLIANCP